MGTRRRASSLEWGSILSSSIRPQGIHSVVDTDRYIFNLAHLIHTNRSTKIHFLFLILKINPNRVPYQIFHHLRIHPADHRMLNHSFPSWSNPYPVQTPPLFPIFSRRGKRSTLTKHISLLGDSPNNTRFQHIFLIRLAIFKISFPLQLYLSFSLPLPLFLLQLVV